MRPRRLVLLVIAAPLFGCGIARSADTSDDRIALSGDGSTLSHTDGGGGGSVAWLHNFDPSTLVGVAAEHQELSVAHWTFGSVNGALTFGPDGQRYSAYAEAHEGTGDDGPHPFHYSIEAVGLSGSYFHRLTTLLEDKRIDVESTHGNLPKVGISYLWNPGLQTSISYSYSVSGNLGTRLPAIRLDAYSPNLNYLAGAAYGPASAAVLGIDLHGTDTAVEGRLCGPLQAAAALAQRHYVDCRLSRSVRQQAHHDHAQLHRSRGCGQGEMMSWSRLRASAFGSLPTIVVLVVVVAVGTRLMYLSVQHHAAVAREAAVTVGADFTAKMEPPLLALANVATRQAAAAREVQAGTSGSRLDASPRAQHTFWMAANDTVLRASSDDSGLANGIASEWQSAESTRALPSSAILGPMRLGSQWIVAAQGRPPCTPMSIRRVAPLGSVAYADLEDLIADSHLARLVDMGYDFQLSQIMSRGAQPRIFVGVEL